MFGIAVAIALGGCAHIDAMRQKTGTQGTNATPVPPSPTNAANAANASGQDVPLATIIEQDLQTGHYAEAEPELRHYVQKHPGDHTARSLLAQLTNEPTKMLGPVVGTHEVQPGESYSTLAARYLGNAQLFLILARYNHAANPSLLLTGATIQIPASLGRIADTAPAPEGASSTMDASHAAVATPVVTVPETPAQQALRLQAQAVALYQQGHRADALSLLDQALTIAPDLKAADDASNALRKELVLDDHQRAIVLYRDQKLDDAIALWNRVLAVDPSFEPAAIYRARALDLKQRLKQY